MNTRVAVTAACAVLSLTVASPRGVRAQTADIVAPLEQITTRASDTPDGAGLLSVAEAEVDVVRTHVQLSLIENDLSSLDEIQVHNRHVIHALDPAEEPSGPGPGYGLIRALDGIAERAALVADSPDASSASSELAREAERIAAGTADDARSLMEGTHIIDAADDTAEVRALVPQMLSASQKLVDDVAGLREAVTALVHEVGLD